MIKVKLGLILAVILLAVFSVKADVPPLPGFGRVKTDLIVEAKGNLADYRFFLDFYGDLKEIKVNNDSLTIIPPMGGGARYADGKLLAIPRKNLVEFAETSNSDLRNLSESLREKKIAGVIELTKHEFSKDNLLGLTFTTPFYTIEREADTLKVTRSSNVNKTIIIGGILIAGAVLILGVFLFRKASKKV